MELRFNNIAPLTPKAIAEDSLYRFNIPLYQRLFEWSEPQLKGLLIDLANHIRDRKDSPYYIGMMTGNESTPIDLIDGQQRFTTIMLLGIQLRDDYREWEKFVSMDRLAFSARPNDSQYLKSLIARTENYNGPVNERIRKGCEIIRYFLNRELTDFNISKKYYAEKVFEILTFFVYKLPKCYKENPGKLNKFFEAMNSAGRSLEQHEKLKVDLLSRADSSEDKSSLNSIWNITEKFHKPIIYSKDEDFLQSENDVYIRKLLCENKSLSDIAKDLSSDADNGNSLTVELIGMSSSVPDNKTIIDGTSSIVDFEELLLLALDMTLEQNKPYYKAKLEDRFSELPQDKIPDFYRNLFVCRLILDRFIIRIEKDGQRNRYILKTDGEEMSENINKQICQYQSMLYNGGGEMHLWLTPLVRWITEYFRQFGNAPTPDKLFSKIRDIDDNISSHRCPDVDILRYHDSASIYYFQRLDYFLWEKYAIFEDNTLLPREYDSVVRNFNFSSNRSVEHFHPQNETYNEKWTEKYIDEDSKMELSRPIDTFGNLALISASFNSEQSNDNENLKLARIKEQIDGNKLQSIKLLIMYCLAREHNEHWSVDIAVRHGKEMMKILRDSYSKK